jgi:hypothetical protein
LISSFHHNAVDVAKVALSSAFPVQLISYPYILLFANTAIPHSLSLDTANAAVITDLP